MARRYVHPHPRSVPLVTTDIAVEPQAPGVVTAAPRHAPPVSLHRLAMILGAEADADFRSARRVILEGEEALRGRVGERLRAAARSLNIPLPHPAFAASELRSA